MRIILSFLIFSSFGLLPNPGIQDQIVGKWDMKAIYDSGEEVSAQHNPSKNRWITFLEDYSFQSGGDPYGENSGKWEIDAKTNTLFLDSDAGPEDDSYWFISFDEGEMTWQGTQSDFAKRFKILMEKVE